MATPLDIQTGNYFILVLAIAMFVLMSEFGYSTHTKRYRNTYQDWLFSVTNTIYGKETNLTTYPFSLKNFHPSLYEVENYKNFAHSRLIKIGIEYSVLVY